MFLFLRKTKAKTWNIWLSNFLLFVKGIVTAASSGLDEVMASALDVNIAAKSFMLRQQEPKLKEVDQGRWVRVLISLLLSSSLFKDSYRRILIISDISSE
jgi:hypothetical protein